MLVDILDLDGLAPRIGLRQRLIGADLGAKTIGLVLSDVERRLDPIEALRREVTPSNTNKASPFAHRDNRWTPRDRLLHASYGSPKASPIT